MSLFVFLLVTKQTNVHFWIVTFTRVWNFFECVSKCNFQWWQVENVATSRYRVYPINLPKKISSKNKVHYKVQKLFMDPLEVSNIKKAQYLMALICQCISPFFSSKNSSSLRNFKCPPLVMGLNLDVIVRFMNRCSYVVDLKIHPYFLLRKTSNRTFTIQLLRVEVKYNYKSVLHTYTLINIKCMLFI